MKFGEIYQTIKALFKGKWKRLKFCSGVLQKNEKGGINEGKIYYAIVILVIY